MNRYLNILLLTALLLGGCGGPSETPRIHAPADEAVNEPATTLSPVQSAADSAAAATNDSSVAPAIDDHTVVNASIDKLLGDHARYEAVIEAYQKAVTDGDEAAVAALVAYPLKVDFRGSKVMIRDPAAFARDYDKIITPGIARAIKEQKYSKLLVTEEAD